MKTKWLVLLVMALFIATGCSSMSKRAKCASVGAATGAAVGATAGAIIGDMGPTHDNRLGGGIIGGVAGALVGGVTGYLVCKDEPAPAPPVAAPSRLLSRTGCRKDRIERRAVRFRQGCYQG